MTPATTNVRPLSGHASSPLRTEAEAALNRLIAQLNRSEAAMIGTQRNDLVSYSRVVIAEMAQIMLAKQEYDAALADTGER